ncbi:MAG: hypothetical protein NWS63_15245, partial [Saprospiraceae bacterium]|nr:hypothetical protein [Saprospiraceae bacterium]
VFVFLIIRSGIKSDLEKNEDSGYEIIDFLGTKDASISKINREIYTVNANPFYLANLDSLGTRLAKRNYGGNFQMYFVFEGNAPKIDKVLVENTLEMVEYQAELRKTAFAVINVSADRSISIDKK